MAIPKSEIRTKKHLKKHGYYFIRAGRSFGLWDFIASNNKELLFIQTKCNQGPRRAEMDRLEAFKDYPRSPHIRKEIWIWKAYKREPIIKKVR